MQITQQQTEILDKFLFDLINVTLKFSMEDKFLLHLIDVTFNEATESDTVPSTKWALEILKKAGYENLKQQLLQPEPNIKSDLEWWDKNNEIQYTIIGDGIEVITKTDFLSYCSQLRQQFSKEQQPTRELITDTISALQHAVKIAGQLDLIDNMRYFNEVICKLNQLLK